MKLDYSNALGSVLGFLSELRGGSLRSRRSRSFDFSQSKSKKTLTAKVAKKATKDAENVKQLS